jgi:hypothetical protein
VKPLALVLFACLAAGPAARAQPAESSLPPGIEDVLRTLSRALADQDPDSFLENFDRKMPDYEKLHDEIEQLLVNSDVASSIEIVSDEGNDQQRMLQLDWLLHVDMNEPRRQIIKCKMERQGRKGKKGRWKIVSLEPVEFFKPAALP